MLFVAQPVWPAGQESVVNTPHNLSVSGPGLIRAPGETEVCIFCHVAHRAGVTPLWNRSLPKTAYITYQSSTAKAAPGQPTGASKLCLSCHDGTIALGRLLSRPGQVMMGGGQYPRGRRNLGTDLSDDHPISMNYKQAPSAKFKAMPARAGESLLDRNGQVQCTSCHDAHSNLHGDFLVMDNREGRLCLTCHAIEEWALSSHNTSTARWTGAGRDPWPNTDYEDVRSNACANCHSVHDAGGKEHLLYFESRAENCYSCHNGAVASEDVRADFQKPFRHRVERAVGSSAKLAGGRVDTSRVGCSDCHNAHGSNDTPAVKPQVPGAMRAVMGVSSAGGIVQEARYEYEVCYKCHTYATQRNLARQIRRARMQSSLRERFNPSAISFHPVEATGRNPDVPSLVPPWDENSRVSCTDCHSNDSGVRGPHGSQYRYLLARQYETGDLISESEQVYALCYLCHDRLNILSDRSFAQHSNHVSRQRAPCSVCHTAHGVARTEGTAVNNAHLINFDITVVRRDTVTGRLEYVAEGFQAGTCFLNCHGVDHSPKSY